MSAQHHVAHFSGKLLLDRYLVSDVVGSGGFGHVFEAHDQLSGSRVAVKTLHAEGPDAQARWQREVRAVQQLSISQAPAFLASGALDGEQFLVMEFADGRPFPGQHQPLQWFALAGLARSLLTAVGGLHVNGLSHRDLKPSNVLVNDRGEVILLDFGLARASDGGDTITRSGAPGTVAYMPPEALRSRHYDTVRGDLYSVGVMLYEALTGSPPFMVEGSVNLASKLTAEPAPVTGLAPSCPAAVGDWVMSLIASDPRARPLSAESALRRLDGEEDVTSTRRLPFLAIDRLLERGQASLMATQSVDIHGASGLGRARLAREIARRVRLSAEGTSPSSPVGELSHTSGVINLSMSHTPYGSLLTALGVQPEPHLSLQELQRWLLNELVARVDDGAVLIAHQWDRLDTWSRQMLSAAPNVPIIRTSDTPLSERSLPVRAFSTEELGGLLRGHQRVHGVVRRVAKLLHDMTHGIPALVSEELKAWLRLGLATQDQAGIWVAPADVQRIGQRVRRAAIDRVHDGHADRVAVSAETEPAIRRAPAVAAPSKKTAHLGGSTTAAVGDVAAREGIEHWVALAWPNSRPSLIAQASGKPLWWTQARCEDLARQHRVIVLPDGRYRPVDADFVATSLRAASASACHRRCALALAPGARGRLHHLALAGAQREVLAESARVALARADRGDLDAALEAVEIGLRFLNAGATVSYEQAAPLFKISLRVGLELRSDAALRRLEAAVLPYKDGAVLGVLIRRARDAQERRGPEALAAVMATEAPADPELLIQWLELGARASNGSPIEAHAQWFATAEAACAGATDRRLLSLLAGWRSRLAYRRGDYLAAAQIAAHGASTSPDQASALLLSTNSASAYLEAGDLDLAIQMVETARWDAAALGLAYVAARAEWIYRGARYRRGDELVPDLALAAAVGDLSVPFMSALVRLQEATVAWRGGNTALTRQLLAGVEAECEALSMRWAALFAYLLHGGHDVAPAPLWQRWAAAWELQPDDGLALQAAALIARLDGAAPPAQVQRALIRWRDRSWPSHRLDVLSAAESLAAFAAPTSGNADRG